MNNPLGWDTGDFAPDNSQMREAALAQYNLDCKYLETFSTPAGQEVLAHLRENTIESATWMASLEYNKAVAHGFAREGQNALVRNIEQRIARADNAKSFDDYLTKGDTNVRRNSRSTSARATTKRSRKSS